MSHQAILPPGTVTILAAVPSRDGDWVCREEIRGGSIVCVSLKDKHSSGGDGVVERGKGGR